MKRILASVLCVVVLVGLVLCGCKKQESLVGTWEGEVDLSKSLTEKMTEEDAQMSQYFNLDGFVMKIRLTFRDDGTCLFEADPDDAKSAFARIKSKLVDGVEKFLESTLATSNVTLEQALGQYGMSSVEEMVDQLLGEDEIETLISELGYEGSYKAEKGKLYTGTLDAELDEESNYNAYALSGGELRIMEGKSDENDPFAGMYPVVLKKVTK